MNSTIPRFPATKHLEVGDKADLDAHFRQFPPYSQFSFASLHAYDYRGDLSLTWATACLCVDLPGISPNLRACLRGVHSRKSFGRRTLRAMFGRIRSFAPRHERPW